MHEVVELTSSNGRNSVQATVTDCSEAGSCVWRRDVARRYQGSTSAAAVECSDLRCLVSEIF